MLVCSANSQPEKRQRDDLGASAGESAESGNPNKMTKGNRMFVLVITVVTCDFNGSVI